MTIVTNELKSSIFIITVHGININYENNIYPYFEWVKKHFGTHVLIYFPIILYNIMYIHGTLINIQKSRTKLSILLVLL